MIKPEIEKKIRDAIKGLGFGDIFPDYFYDQYPKIIAEVAYEAVLKAYEDVLGIFESHEYRQWIPDTMCYSEKNRTCIHELQGHQDCGACAVMAIRRRIKEICGEKNDCGK